MIPLFAALRVRAHAAAAAVPAPYRTPALAAAFGALVLLLIAALSALRGAPRAQRARDAAADAAFRLATVTHVQGAPVCPSGSGNGAGAGCGALEFVRYTPAPLEALWAAKAPELAGRECAQIVAERAQWQAQLDGVRAGGAAAATDASSSSSGSSSSGSSGSTWSVATYRNAATGAEVNVALEPLAGIMRDPRPICGGLQLTPRKAARGIDSRDFHAARPGLLRKRWRRSSLCPRLHPRRPQRVLRRLRRPRRGRARCSSTWVRRAGTRAT